MHADLDTLLTTVYCMADDLVPCKPANARRRVTDAELVTLCVAQAIMGIPSDERFLATARKQLRGLFPRPPKRPGYHKRRRRLSDQIEALISVFARECPGYHDSVVLLDSTPVECGRSRETVERSALADAAGYGYCRSHSRYFWGMRLHGCFGLDGTPRGAILWGADRPEREVARELLPRVISGTEAVVCDKGYASAEFEAEIATLGTRIIRPARRDEPSTGLRLASLRQRIESVYQTLKDILTLGRHGARTLENLRVRIAQRLLALAACVYVNHWSGVPEPLARGLRGLRAWNKPSRGLELTPSRRLARMVSTRLLRLALARCRATAAGLWQRINRAGRRDLQAISSLRPEGRPSFEGDMPRRGVPGAAMVLRGLRRHRARDGVSSRRRWRWADGFWDRGMRRNG